MLAFYKASVMSDFNKSLLPKKIYKFLPPETARKHRIALIPSCHQLDGIQWPPFDLEDLQVPKTGSNKTNTSCSLFSLKNELLKNQIK